MTTFMQAAEIRQSFLDYFAQHGHTIVPSGALIPANDATLLFCNAGMVPFKDTFLGLEQRPYTRATTAQKCLRVSGKHNDLESVGPSPRHHTFFEMLGNFSFGDYFKREAMRLAWELLTRQWQLPVERLWVSIHVNDDEAARLWEEVGVERQRILRFGDKNNFWSMGDTGPCGPNSEIHYYQGLDVNAQRPEGVNSDDDDYVEIWNLVFMQYKRDAQGTLTPLPRPAIDTGMGLERIAAALQGVRNNYETDLFTPLIERTRTLLSADTRHYREHQSAYHIIADHSRAITFLLADGIHPGNEGRDYVLRRILRRAAYQGRALGFAQPFLASVADVVIDSMGPVYPELFTQRATIKQSITDEEERFLHTLTSGLHHLEEVLAQTTGTRVSMFPGRAAFTLHDTYGFPLNLTQNVLAERGIAVDIQEYDEARREQQERSRAAMRFKRDDEAERWSTRALAPTTFIGYTHLRTEGRIIALEVAGQDVQSATAGQQVKLVLDRTPFYAESGGQVADTGQLHGPHGLCRIDDVQKPVPDIFVHQGVIEHGSIAVGEVVELTVDSQRRSAIMRNHTATHLLHRALREVVGNHAQQAGSLVAPEYLRFDFTQPRQLTSEQVRELERRVNAWIRADYRVETALMDYTAARETGAMALFSEKYGASVRVVTIEHNNKHDDFSGLDAVVDSQYPLRSSELCGGTHVTCTGQIGQFRIVAESSVSAGQRRIEALTGSVADTWVERQSQLLHTLSTKLATPHMQLAERVGNLLGELKQRNAELVALHTQLLERQVGQLLEQVRIDQDVSYLAAQVNVARLDLLRQLIELVSCHLPSGIVVLGAVIEEKPHIVVSVSADLVERGYHAGKIARALASVIGGGGGGRVEIAQAGGRDPQALSSALEHVVQILSINA